MAADRTRPRPVGRHAAPDAERGETPADAPADVSAASPVEAVEAVGEPLPHSWRARLMAIGGVRQIAAISASLVGTQAVTSVLGLLYWAVAARQSSVADVGVAGAAVALMLLLGSFGMLGLGTLLIAEMPKVPDHDRRLLVRTSLVTAAVASTLLGAGAAIVLGLLGSATSLTSVGTPFNVADFAIGTGLTGLTMVLDQAVLVVGMSRVQLERNTLSSVVKIAVLIGLGLAGHTDGMDIFLSWTIGNAVSLLLVLARTHGGRAVQASRRFVDPRLFRRMARSAASHHLLNIMLQAPMLLLSLVVAVALTAEDNGYFSTARSIAGFVFVLPFSITIALFASASGGEAELARRMRFSIPFGLAASVAADIVLFPFGSTILGIFGSTYSTEAVTTLQVLVLAGVPFVVKDHFVALRRVQNRTGNAAVAALAGAAFELVAAYVGAQIGGTVGLCAFWVGALCIEAALIAPVLIASVRGAHAPEADEPASGVRPEELIPSTVSPMGADR